MRRTAEARSAAASAVGVEGVSSGGDVEVLGVPASPVEWLAESGPDALHGSAGCGSASMPRGSAGAGVDDMSSSGGGAGGSIPHVNDALRWLEAAGAATPMVTSGKKAKRREPKLFLQLKAGCNVDDDAEFSGDSGFQYTPLEKRNRCATYQEQLESISKNKNRRRRMQEAHPVLFHRVMGSTASAVASASGLRGIDGGTVGGKTETPAGGQAASMETSSQSVR